MNNLRKFIREELTWNYWMRRPRNSQAPDVSAELATDREERFLPVASEFDDNVGKIRHRIETAGSINNLEDTLEDSKIDAYDIVADPTRFDQAVDRDDLQSVKDQLIQGLETWADEKIEKSQNDSYDATSLMASLEQ